MKLIKPSYEILSPLIRENVLKAIEIAGRTCYKSEDRITEDSASKFVEMINGRGHRAVVEHQSITVRFICDRGVSHELVRHRLASFCQESTRYCNYSKDKFDSELTFIIPSWFKNQDKELLQALWDRSAVENVSDDEWCEVEWYCVCDNAEESYLTLLKKGWQAQQARSILPNSLKTEIVVTANIREWQEILKQRTSPAAHPQMRELMIPLQKELQTVLPELFGDYQENTIV